MAGERPEFVPLPQIETSGGNVQNEPQPTQAERKRGRPRLSDEERKRREAERQKRYYQNHRSEIREYHQSYYSQKKNIEQKGTAGSSQISDEVIEFVQRAYAAGADANLDERGRLFVAHRITKPKGKWKELAPFGDVQSASAAVNLWNRNIRILRQTSPLELQQSYSLSDLLQGKRGVKAGTIQRSPESRERMQQAQKGRKKSKKVKERMQQAHIGKKFSDEHRRHISEAQQRMRERERVERETRSRQRSAEPRVVISRWIPKKRLQVEEFTLYQKPPQP